MSEYDPHLRGAAEQFKILCKKYDIAGVFLLVSPTHAEFVNHISPSWSVANIESPGVIRFRSKREDFDSKEQQRRCTEATVHMLTSIIEWSRKVNIGMRSVIEQLGKHMKIAWKTWGDEPDSAPEEKE